MPDQFSFVLEKELLVQINEDLMTVFDEESIQILFEILLISQKGYFFKLHSILMKMV